jgi:hypothetical protein
MYTDDDLERADHMLKRWDVMLLGPDVCLAQTIAMVRAEERRYFVERLYAIREEVACGDSNGRLADLIEELSQS